MEEADCVAPSSSPTELESGIIAKDQAPLQGVCVLSPGVPAEALDRHCHQPPCHRRGGQGGDVWNGPMPPSY